MSRVLPWVVEWAAEARTRDCAAVVVPNSIVIALMNLLPINQVISAAAGLMALAYTAWRWRRDARREREERNERTPQRGAPTKR